MIPSCNVVLSASVFSNLMFLSLSQLPPLTLYNVAALLYDRVLARSGPVSVCRVALNSQVAVFSVSEG